MIRDLTYASIDWQNDTTPKSTVFDDCYFSVTGGKEETLHNFIKGNKIPERFGNAPDGCGFTIAETGFGTGSNLWVLLEHAGDYLDGRSLELTFVSFEKYPLAPGDLQHYLQKIYRIDESLFDTAGFLAEYQNLQTGRNSLKIDSGSVTVNLILYIGDLNDYLDDFAWEYRDGVDAWFLDGFAPCKNSDMWTPELFKTMFMTSKINGTFATFTVAGIVRRGLRNAGFSIMKVPGCGLKREILTGIRLSGE
ncbi:MAG: tRNA (5-methylaminomethyl-2-thiouridine)(34)-methyltransferase MnmD [Succinivibrionaceae bacterium]|nr:tRNA (5-methylaminomethyl-2-thiouridine)(34)-methyltransferase MnmD [Succinivibrionaceae bacterium]